MKFKQRVTLIGFKMSGKTTLGRLVAQDLGCSFIDTDRELEKKYHPLSCKEIHLNLGNEEFRQAELRVIQNLDYTTPFVLATGGGTITIEESARLLAEKTTVIYLKVPQLILKQRIFSLPSLPSFLLSKDPDEEFERLYKERIPLYERWSHYTIEIEELSVESSAEICIRLLSKLALVEKIDDF